MSADTTIAENPSADKKKVQVIKASTMLQAKVGLGPLNEKIVRRCQDVMDNNNVDFAPLAKDYLRRLEAVIHETQEGGLHRDAAVQAMTEPVMQLKAHASMFNYPLIGKLANIMLSFLESVETIDDDVIEIVQAHHQTLKTIVAKKMEGQGGNYGKVLEDELNFACRRYHSKQK